MKADAGPVLPADNRGPCIDARRDRIRASTERLSQLAEKSLLVHDL
jgi:hypothetical protein